MRSFFLASATVLAFSQQALSVGVWGQCGGLGYTGSTVCDAGSGCVKSNDWYSQCLPGAATSAVSTVKVTTSTQAATSTKAATSTSASPSTTKITTSTQAATSTKVTTVAPSTTKASSTVQPTTASTTVSAPSSSVCPGTRTKFTYFGVNESGAEFGDGKIPGILGTDYIWPEPSSIDFFVGKGMNTFRIPFKLERLIPLAGGITGPLDATYLSGLTTIVNYITNKGAFAVIEPHNYMMYNGAQITSTSDFAAAWTKIATQFKSNSKVIFDIMNEPHDIAASTAFGLNQAAVNAIRATGATSQLILVEGTAWTGAWSWTSSGNADAFKAIQDPNNNIAIEMHQYLDGDSSGTSPTCVSSTIGAERIADATAWLKANNLKGFLGEIGAGSNDQCIAAIKGALCAMQQSGVWIGALYWAAGPWWGDYFQSIEPPSGASVSRILPEALLPFL